MGSVSPRGVGSQIMALLNLQPLDTVSLGFWGAVVLLYDMTELTIRGAEILLEAPLVLCRHRTGETQAPEESWWDENTPGDARANMRSKVGTNVANVMKSVSNVVHLKSHSSSFNDSLIYWLTARSSICGWKASKVELCRQPGFLAQDHGTAGCLLSTNTERTLMTKANLAELLHAGLGQGPGAWTGNCHRNQTPQSIIQGLGDKAIVTREQSQMLW